MRIKVGDLVRIKEEHVDHELIHDDLAWDSIWTGNPPPPPETEWIGLVMDCLVDDDGTILDDMIYIQWTWSGRTVLEYTEHLEVICK
tara:strand:+ start:1399 stop:1659 length:261 start_codon:yes stop_codon:yes gene_type:complete